ncbi:MAG: hypothetical protein O9325_19170 [Roseomonas sp.]|nr:hypothetical protein [Roseomonas sp.]
MAKYTARSLGVERAMKMAKIIDWFAVRDYDRAKEKAAISIAARYARGNVAVQNGWFIDQSGLDKLSAHGDAATKQLKAAIGHKV